METTIREMTQAEMDGIEIERVTSVEYVMTLQCWKCGESVPSTEAETIGRGRYCVPCAEAFRSRVLEVVA